MVRLRHNRAYGWLPDVPDQRDHVYAASPAALPTSVDLRPHCPSTVYDQGNLGSCTANAIAGAIEFDDLKQGRTPAVTPSRLFIYYNERALEGTVRTDSGALIRDGIKSVARLGAPGEADWRYDVQRFADRPPAAVYAEARGDRVTSYQRLARNLTQMKGCLAEGFPFVFGFTVYESFEGVDVAHTGNVPLPSHSEQALGGHAVMAVGFDDATGRFLARNSWGPDWGLAGYFTMPYGYLTDANLSDDFWTIRAV
jgi:C1A family cysteine protease